MTDQEIVEKIKLGDRLAYVSFVKAHERLVWHMIGKIIREPEDIEEIAQDVFLKVFSKLDTFKFESKLSTWVATVAYRMTLNFAKKKKLPIMLMDNINEYELQLGLENSPLAYVEDRELKAQIHALVKQLPGQYQLVLSLFHLKEMSYPEIAEVTGMPVGTVKNYLFRARKILKEKFGEQLKEVAWG